MDWNKIVMQGDEQIRKLMNERVNNLELIIDMMKKELKFKPDGSLRINGTKNNKRYYHKESVDGICSVRYLKVSEFETVLQLAQKGYEEKVLKAAERELDRIRRFLVSGAESIVESVYGELNPERQKLVIPLIEPDEQFVAGWESEVYKGKGFFEGAPEFYTAKGERVRSKSEIIIADLLGKEGVPYKYERPLQLKASKAAGRGTMVQTVHPDFTILNVRTRDEKYWEHFGMMDDPEYAEKALRKIQLYEQNGIYINEKLVVTFETKLMPVNQHDVLAKIERHLK